MCITQRALQRQYSVTQASEMYILSFYVCLFEWLLDFVMEACNMLFGSSTNIALTPMNRL
jgi:hypothetical protein